VITPDAHDLPELVRELHRSGTAWLPAGLGSRLHWGPPVAAGLTVLSCAALTGVVEHNPGDFTIGVRAGMPVAELQAVLAAERQWLALDPAWGPAGSSVGGLVARGLAGGYRQRYLGVRDQLIGIGLLRADGTVARAGGRVVKNVAGYDLMRLFCGSWGSLGLITELTLRTLPLPPQRRGLLVQGEPAALAPLAAALLASGLTPERIDWCSASLAAAAGQGADAGLLIGLASIDAASLEEQAAAIAALTPLPATPLAPEALAQVVAVFNGQAVPEPAWLLRLGVPPDRAAPLLAEPALAGLPLQLAAGAGVGLAWAAPADALSAARVEQARLRCRELGGWLSVLVQPAGASLNAWDDAPSRPLIEAVKRQFDPAGLLAPGRLPGVARPLQADSSR